MNNNLKTWLSHHPLVYAFVGGIGVILFWRGVWHTMDYLTQVPAGLWWDGPLSLVIGGLILLMTGAFISSLIGNEIIISGLRAEQRQLAKTGGAIHNEAAEIAELQEAFVTITAKLNHLERHLNKAKQR